MCETFCAPKKCETVHIISNEHPSFLMTNVISSTSSVVVAGLLGCSAPAALARKMRPSMEDTSVASSKSFPRTTRRCSQMEISVFSFEHGKLHAKTVEILLWQLKLNGNSIWSCIVSMLFHTKTNHNRPHRAQHLEFPKLEWNSWTQKNTISLVYSVHFLTGGSKANSRQDLRFLVQWYVWQIFVSLSGLFSINMAKFQTALASRLPRYHSQAHPLPGDLMQLAELGHAALQSRWFRFPCWEGLEGWGSPNVAFAKMYDK